MDVRQGPAAGHENAAVHEARNGHYQSFLNWWPDRGEWYGIRYRGWKFKPRQGGPARE